MGTVKAYYNTKNLLGAFILSTFLGGPLHAQITAEKRAYIQEGLNEIEAANNAANHRAALDAVVEVLPADRQQFEHAAEYSFSKRKEAIDMTRDAINERFDPEEHLDPGLSDEGIEPQYMHPLMYNQLAQPIRKWQIAVDESGNPIEIPIFSDGPIPASEDIYQSLRPGGTRPIIKTFRDKKFQEGNDLESIISLMLENDYIENNIDFLGDAGDWSSTLECWNPETEELSEYQRFWFPMVYGEIAEDPLRGEYLPTVQRDQILQALVSGGDQFFKNQAPFEVNRIAAIAGWSDDGDVKSLAERNNDHLAAIRGGGGPARSFPNEGLGEDQIREFPSNPLAYIRSNHGRKGRGIDFHRFNSLATDVGMIFWPSPDGNCMDRPLMPLGLHRSDNETYFPYTRSKVYSDLLMLLNGKQGKFRAGDAIGACMNYDLKISEDFNYRSGPSSLSTMGANYSFLQKVNPGGLSPEDTRNNCMRESGSIYPLSHEVQNNKNFQANFFLQMIRSTKMTRYMADGLGLGTAPSFHRWGDNEDENGRYYERGDNNHYASKLQLIRGSFIDGSEAKINEENGFELNIEARELTEEHEDFYRHLWQTDASNPDAYRNQRGMSKEREEELMDGVSERDWNRAVWVEWHYAHICCRPGHEPIPEAPQTQIRGLENFTEDEW